MWRWSGCLPKSLDKTLYLGTDPTRCPLSGEIVHYPVVRVVAKPEDHPDILAGQIAFEKSTHVIFTSKHGVEISARFFFGLERKEVYSVGIVTTESLHRIGIREVKTATEECQEGLIELLKQENFTSPSFFLPGSCRARPLLREWLQMQGFLHVVCALYDLEFQSPRPLPKLQEFDRVVFTSPSTVEAFHRIFPKLPYHLQLFAKGDVTRSAVSKLYKKPLRSILRFTISI